MLARAPEKTSIDPILAILSAFRGPALGVVAFSGAINLLMLTGPLFMLQVYDRVLPSRSIPTLTAFVILMVVLFAFMGALEFLRSRVLAHFGQHVDETLSADALAIVLAQPLQSANRGTGTQPVRDLEQLRQFIGSPGPAAFLDLPWTPVYLVVVFLFHPLLGVIATAGAVVLVCLTVLNEMGVRKPTLAVGQHTSLRLSHIEAGRRNAEVIQALGMRADFTRRFDDINRRFLAATRMASDVASSFGTATKVFRFVLQSLVLAIAAILVIRQEATPGVMIAASIISSRALSPIEQAIAHWRTFVAARQSYRRLSRTLTEVPKEPERTSLPSPKRSLSVRELAVIPPGANKPVVSGISFDLKAGDGLGIIGPSASGKSTLARALVNVWRPARGTVRLDGAELAQRQPEALGPHIGYLPQDVELFQGTVAENITRFSQDASNAALLEAAETAGAHHMILGLPGGYDTQIGENGCALSAGQRQRIALARALYGNPFLIVLDEPNSNIDAQGEDALRQAVIACRKRGAIVIVIAHRPSAIAAVDLLLVLDRGQIREFGPKEDVLRKTIVPAVSGAAAVRAAAAGPVSELAR